MFLTTILLTLAQLVSADADFDTVASRRRADIAVIPITASYARNAKYSDIPTWISTIKADGSWPDVNYTAGCGGGEALAHIADHNQS